MLHLNYEPQSCQQGQKPTQMQLFQLIPLGVNCIIPKTIVDFNRIQGISQIPTLKKDPNFLPCLFVSPEQKFTLDYIERKPKHSTQEILTETFQAKMSQAYECPEPMKKCLYKPKPSSNYCQICRQKFNDYEQHIMNNIHKKKLNQNEFNQHIERFVYQFQKQEQNKFKRTKPVIQKTQKKTLSSYQSLQRQVKKIVINRQQCKSISILNTKIDSQMIDNKDI